MNIRARSADNSEDTRNRRDKDRGSGTTPPTPAVVAPALMPGWMQHIADFNPVNWALVAGRSAMAAEPQWADVFSRGGALLGLALVAVWLSTRTFRAYQKSV